MHALIPRRRRYGRLAVLVYAVFASTCWGRLRGRPLPGRAILTLLSTGMNFGLSPSCPPVATTAKTMWPCSHARCVLVVHPPR